MSDEDLEEDWKLVRPNRLPAGDSEETPPKSYVWVGWSIDRQEVPGNLTRIEVPEPTFYKWEEPHTLVQFQRQTRFVGGTVSCIIYQGKFLPKVPVVVDRMELYLHPSKGVPIAGVSFNHRILIENHVGYDISFRIQAYGLLERCWVVDSPNGPVLTEYPLERSDGPSVQPIILENLPASHIPFANPPEGVVLQSADFWGDALLDYPE